MSPKRDWSRHGEVSVVTDSIRVLVCFCSVYFVGQNAKKRSGVLGGANNGGYDDDQGSYIQVPHDHIAYRYEVLKVIGKGSFGQVRIQEWYWNQFTCWFQVSQFIHRFFYRESIKCEQR